MVYGYDLDHPKYQKWVFDLLNLIHILELSFGKQGSLSFANVFFKFVQNTVPRNTGAGMQDFLSKIHLIDQESALPMAHARSDFYLN